MMKLSMRGELAIAFKSGSQKAGKVTEAWGADNFYCPNCSSQKLNWLKAGTQANDYRCPTCEFWFQLKSKKSPIGATITDGAYAAMMKAIREDRSPNFFFLHYDETNWTVRNLLLVPHFAFPPSAIIKRPPLAPTARRAGWIGCNFDLRRIPAEARIEIISTRRRRGNESLTEKQNQRFLTSSPTIIKSPAEVRAQFKKVKPFKEISVKERGWTLDVLNVVAAVCDRRSLQTATIGTHRAPLQDWKQFTNEDVYAFAHELEKLHPDNRHLRDKIRQQLQVLRDAGLLIHVSSGVWRLP